MTTEQRSATDSGSTLRDEGSGPYTAGFFGKHRVGSRRSAGIVIPLLFERLAPMQVSSVVDVGCGVGTWLAAFQEAGVRDVQGLDGEYVARSDLQISEASFLTCDLNSQRADELLSRSFDLAVCLEVAEHLEHARTVELIDSLTRLAPVVLFSAAVPFQPGTNHINCQWQSHWARLFMERDFLPLDVLRPMLWCNDDVEWWYAQNIVLYMHRQVLSESPSLQREVVADIGLLDKVHPGFHRWCATLPNHGVKALGPAFVRALRSAVARRLG